MGCRQQKIFCKPVGGGGGGDEKNVKQWTRQRGWTWTQRLRDGDDDKFDLWPARFWFHSFSPNDNASSCLAPPPLYSLRIPIPSSSLSCCLSYRIPPDIPSPNRPNHLACCRIKPYHSPIFFRPCHPTCLRTPFSSFFLFSILSSEIAHRAHKGVRTN